MKLLATGLLSILLLLACGPSLKEVMDSWVGHHRDDLIRKWGPPTKETPLSNGGSILSYQRSGGQVFVPVGSMVVASPRSCQQDFETNSSGRIVNWRYEGRCR
jgi:hypothetical protein